MHSKRFTLKPLFNHTTFTLVMLNYMCSHSCSVGGRLMEAWQPICIKRPLWPLNINSHSYEATSVKCLAQGHNDRLRCSRIWNANPLVNGQPAVLSEPQLPQSIPKWQLLQESVFWGVRDCCGLLPSFHRPLHCAVFVGQRHLTQNSTLLVRPIKNYSWETKLCQRYLFMLNNSYDVCDCILSQSHFSLNCDGFEKFSICSQFQYWN